MLPVTPTTATPRPVTPPMRLNPRGLVPLGALVLCGVVLMLIGALRTEAADPISIPAIVEGAPGLPLPPQYVEVQPEPRSAPNLPMVGFGAFLLLIGATTIASSAKVITAGRDAQRRAASVVGTGPGPVVRLVPTWAATGVPLHAELWPGDGGPPLGRIGLARVDRGFDPHVPFRAWGGPGPDGAALTSVDGAQLVLPTSGVTDVRATPGLDPAVTAACATVLGWPTADGPGDPARIGAVDAAVDELRRRSRWATPAMWAGGAGVGAFIVAAVEASGPGRGIMGCLAVLSGVAALGARDVAVAPLAALVDPVVGPDRTIRRKVLSAVNQARWTRAASPGPRPGPQGWGWATDGSGWMPPPPPR